MLKNQSKMKMFKKGNGSRGDFRDGLYLFLLNLLGLQVQQWIKDYELKNLIITCGRFKKNEKNLLRNQKCHPAIYGITEICHTGLPEKFFYNFTTFFI